MRGEAQDPRLEALCLCEVEVIEVDLVKMVGVRELADMLCATVRGRVDDRSSVFLLETGVMSD